MPGQPKYGMGRRGGTTLDLTLPSYAYDEQGNATTEHNVCKVRRADPQALIAVGILDDFDSLTRLTQLKIDEIEQGDNPAKPSEAEQVKALAASKDDLLAGLAMIDKIVEYIVVEPKVVRPVRRDDYGVPLKVTAEVDGKPVEREIPLLPIERDPEVLYTDDVDLEDRMFILSYAMDGSKDLESFRAGHEALVATVANGQELPLSTVITPGDRIASD